jgi:hypothetical protein
MGLGGPSRINTRWDWVGLAVLLVAIGVGVPTTIDTNGIGWAQQNQYTLGDWGGLPLLLVAIGLGGPSNINTHWDWAG